ncbi:MAG: hypothetical protein AB1468_00610 [Candidatus Micrarchaeota archaeon]
MFEFRRQLAHIAFGLGVMLLLHVFLSAYGSAGIEKLEMLLVGLFLIGVILLDLKLKEKRLPLIDEALEILERQDGLPAHGAFWYVLGVLALLSFLRDANFMYASLLILALGDGLSTLLGQFGRMKLPYNSEKTFEGALAFFIGGLPAYFFVGAGGALASAVCALIESFKIDFDDNFVVPLACIVIFKFVGA